MIGPVAMIPSCFYLPTAEGEYGLDLVVPLPFRVREKLRSDYLSLKEGKGMSRFRHFRPLVSRFIFPVPAIESRSFDVKTPFANKKSPPTSRSRFACPGRVS